RCLLWPETVTALRAAIAVRPKPAQSKDCDLVFLTPRGYAFVRTTEVSNKDRIAIQFTALLKTLGVHREGLGFYTLRHVFRTIADAARDPVAIDLIMGHTDPTMAARYRERVDDTRLKAVTDHVHSWLWPKSETKPAGQR